MRYDNPADPVYAPNSSGGPAADPELWTGDSYEVAGEIVRAAYEAHAEDDDVGQARTLWEKVLTDTGRDHMVGNITAHAGAPEVSTEMRRRIARY
jgi:catalase